MKLKEFNFIIKPSFSSGGLYDWRQFKDESVKK